MGKKLELNETESEKAAKAVPAAEAPAQKYKVVQLGLVDESPTNPRKHFDAAKLAELAADIRLHGVMQPLVVRPRSDRFELVFGHRRLRAAKLAGLAEVPVLVVELGDQEVVERQLVENAKRDDLTPLEVARAYAQLQKGGLSAEAIGAKVGRSASSIRAALKLVELVPEAVKLLEAGKLTASTGLLVGRLPKPVQLQVVKRLGSDYRIEKSEYDDPEAPIPFRGLQDLIRSDFMLELGPGKSCFDSADATLGKGGSCLRCPKNTACNRELFPDDQPGKDVEGICTDLECYRAKEAAWLERKKVEGAKVLSQKEVKEVFATNDTHPTCSSEYVEAPSNVAKDKVVLAQTSAGVQRLVKKSDLPKEKPREKSDWEKKYDAQRKAEKARREFEEAVDERMKPALVARVEKWTAADEKRFWRWRCEDLLAYASLEPLVSLERRQLTTEGAKTRIDTFTVAELRAIAIELEYLGHRGTDELAEAFGVDRKKYEAEVKAEARAAEPAYVEENRKLLKKATKKPAPAKKAGKKKAA